MDHDLRRVKVRLTAPLAAVPKVVRTGFPGHDVTAPVQFRLARALGLAYLVLFKDVRVPSETWSHDPWVVSGLTAQHWGPNAAAYIDREISDSLSEEQREPPE